MKEADLSLTNLGYYNQGSSAGSTARAVSCEAFDGYKRSSKPTGGYGFQIEKSELFLLGGTTGANMTSILFKYAARGICDGCENRFLYAVVKNGIVDYDERQERLSGATKNLLGSIT
ncbi:unnamed protein product [Didymodactylos carnosus]|uniref:Uncharacterized protein n=2 Tax=Didymodactylos carnosus TaxID=1234261 RepID=A0A8S2CT47_9BILA|nr:unnamed protein product [Didymodactylos carnosus]CAF3580135.1 unnamed protein product [Didymodactylos carnosus]